jgi:hypothetical protein
LFSGIAAGEFCGAPIGRGKKMCVKVDCDVVSHGTKPKTSESEFGGPGPQVFIKVPHTGSKTEATAVYLSPSVSADAFSGPLSAYLRQERTVDQWTSFFGSLAATPSATEEEEEIIADIFSEPPPGIAYTPRMTRSSGKRKAPSPEVDLDVDFEMTESKYDFQVPKTLPSAMYEGNSEAAIKLRALAPLWSGLVKNTDTLMDLVNQVYAIEVESRKRAKVEATEAKLSVTTLATRLGERPASLGTDSIYEVLEELLRDVGSLQAALRDITDPKAEANRQECLVEAVGDIIVQPMRPLFMLYNALSSARDAPGDRLEARLRRLEAGVGGRA